MQTNTNELIKASKGGAAYVFGYFFVRSFGFITMPILTRVMTPEQYGMMTLCFVLPDFLSHFFNVGQLEAIQKFYHEYSSSRWKFFWSTCVYNIAIFSIIIIVLLLTVGTKVIDLFAPNVPIYPYILLAMIFSFLMTFFNVEAKYLQVKENSVLFVKLIIARTAIRVTFLLTLLFLMSDKLLATLLAGVASAVFGFVVFFINSRSDLVLKYEPRMSKQMLRFGLPVAVNDLALMTMLRIDMVFVANYMDTHAVAIYSVAIAVSGVIFMINMGVNDAWTPFFFRYAKEKGDEAKAFLGKMATYFVIIVWPVNFLVAVFGGDLLLVLAGKQYAESQTVIGPLILAAMIAALQYRFINPLYFKKHTEIVATATIIAAGINVGANFLLIPRFGIMGAAISMVLSRIVYSTILYFAAQRVYRIEYEWGRIAKLFLVLLGGYLLSEYAHAHLTYGMALAAKFGIVTLVFTFLFAIQIVTRNEREQILAILVQKVPALKRFTH